MKKEYILGEKKNIFLVKMKRQSLLNIFFIVYPSLPPTSGI